MQLLSNVALVLDSLIVNAKAAKKELVKLYGDTAPDLPGSVAVIRSGTTQVAYTFHDDAIAQAFAVGARIFEGETLGLILDGIDLKENGHATFRPQMMVFAIDRDMNTAWQKLPYDLSVFGLSWDLPSKGAGGPDAPPPFLAGHVFEDMKEMMAKDAIIPTPVAIQGVLSRLVAEVFGHNGPDSVSESQRAVLDLAAAETLQLHGKAGNDYGICAVQLMGEPGTPRGEVLRRAGADLS